MGLREWEEFKTNRIWRAIENEWKEWLEDIRNQLEDPDGTLPDKVLHHLGGSAKAVRTCISIVDTNIETIKSELEDEDGE